MKAQSHIIASASGSIGGMTFRNTRHGMIISGKATPRQRSTPKDAAFFGPGLLPTMPDLKQLVSSASRLWGLIPENIRRTYDYMPAGFKSPMEYFMYISYSRLLIGVGLKEPAPTAKVPNWFPFSGTKVLSGELGWDGGLPPNPQAFPYCYALSSQRYDAPTDYIPPLYYCEARLANIVGEWICNPTGYRRLSDYPDVEGYMYVKVFQIEGTTLLRKLMYEGWHQIEI